jgi:transposase
LGKKTLAQRGYPLVKVLGLDEFTIHKGHGHFRLVISAPELGIVLDVLPDRSKESLEAWFAQRGTAWCDYVEVCCADMWDAYHTVAKTKLPHAQPVVDRFHVTKNLNDAVTTARRTIQKQADEATQAILKGCRWLLVKNREKLTDEERAQLAKMLEASPELKTCYDLKADFRTWFDQTTDRETAAKTLSEWQNKAQATKLRSLQAFVKTLDNWREGILNYFNGRHSNGFAEGVNLKIKMLNRRGFGYRNFAHFRLHILVAFEPTSR